MNPTPQNKTALVGPSATYAFLSSGEFRSFESQVVHQTFLTDDKPNDRVFDRRRINGTSGAQGHQCNRTVHACLPAVAVATHYGGLEICLAMMNFLL